MPPSDKKHTPPRVVRHGYASVAQVLMKDTIVPIHHKVEDLHLMTFHDDTDDEEEVPERATAGGLGG